MFEERSDITREMFEGQMIEWSGEYIVKEGRASSRVRGPRKDEGGRLIPLRPINRS